METDERQKFKIPESYGGPVLFRGVNHYEFCDSTIRVHQDGTADETHMSYDGYEGHQFVTRPWPTKESL